MQTLIAWVLPAVLGAVGRILANYFSGTCPAAAASFLCSHWQDIATAAGVILGGFGIGVHVTAQATVRAAARAAQPPEAPSVHAPPIVRGSSSQPPALPGPPVKEGPPEHVNPWGPGASPPPGWSPP